MNHAIINPNSQTICHIPAKYNNWKDNANYGTLNEFENEHSNIILQDHLSIHGICTAVHHSESSAVYYHYYTP